MINRTRAIEAFQSIGIALERVGKGFRVRKAGHRRWHTFQPEAILHGVPMFNQAALTAYLKG